ncbi:restriction endonuclease [Desulfovibrio sp. QI0430]
MLRQITKKDIHTLDPTEFENLSFDLLLLLGLLNVKWRTPASDGGRDLVGEYVFKDFSGHTNIQKWHIECKHYKKSISWKVVAEKIYCSSNDRADCMLIMTSSTISNPCKDEIEKWNSNNRFPQIRYWQISDIVGLVNTNSYIKQLYFNQQAEFGTFFSEHSLLQLKKLILTAHAEADGKLNSPSLFAAKCIVELVDDIFSDISNNGHFIIKPLKRDDLENWMEYQGKCVHDRYVFFAILSAAYTYIRPNKFTCKLDKQKTLLCIAECPRFAFSVEMKKFLCELAMLKRYKIIFTAENTFEITQRG